MEERLVNPDVSMVKEKVDRLMSAARDENWDLVDKEIIPDLEINVDGNLLAVELLRYSYDGDANVRDAVATGLVVASITDDEILGRSIEAMITMSKDSEKFPAGRSVVFLGKYKDLEKYSNQIDEAIEGFKGSVENNGWREELLENIPDLEPILSVV
jgi:hypothetical protein